MRAALLDHLVLFFRDQPLEPDEQLRFALRFGPVSVPAFLTTATAVPEVMVLDQVNPKGDGADRWHVDNTYMPCPPMGSILRAVQLPDLGGDTLFASMYEAYDALSPSMRVLLDGAMEVLSTRDREVLRLRFEEDLTQSKVAEQVGYSQMHVSRILRRALGKLREASVDPDAED